MDSHDLAKSITSWLETQAHAEQTAFSSIPDLGIDFGSTIGLVRKENQDRIVVAEYRDPINQAQDFVMAALSDGMGGGRDGGYCASSTLARIVFALTSRSTNKNLIDHLVSVCKDASEALFDEYKDKGGTTFSAVIISRSGETAVVNVGDSRVHQLQLGARDSEAHSKFNQLTQDDNIAGEIAKIRGRLPSDLSGNEYANHLTQYIGAGKDIEPRVYEVSDDGRSSLLVATSDGAHNIGESVLGKLALFMPSSSEFVRRTLHVSRWTGGQDNASILCVNTELLKDYLRVGATERNSLTIWTVGGSRQYFSISSESHRGDQRVKKGLGFFFSDKDAELDESASDDKKPKATRVKRKAPTKDQVAKQETLDIEITSSTEKKDSKNGSGNN
tara:strand:+ start:242 stop:1405 length:1164 start_codon:yes stop_codon:yes gene_type:complete